MVSVGVIGLRKYFADAFTALRIIIKFFYYTVGNQISTRFLQKNFIFFVTFFLFLQLIIIEGDQSWSLLIGAENRATDAPYI